MTRANSYSGYTWVAVAIGQESRGIATRVCHFVKELADYVNKEITDFRRNIMSHRNFGEIFK